MFPAGVVVLGPLSHLTNCNFCLFWARAEKDSGCRYEIMIKSKWNEYTHGDDDASNNGMICIPYKILRRTTTKWRKWCQMIFRIPWVMGATTDCCPEVASLHCRSIDSLGGHISGVISLLGSRVKYNVCRRKEKYNTMLHHVVSMRWEAVGRLL